MIRCGLGGYVLRVASGARQPVTRNHLISSSLIERHPVCPWPDMARKTAFALMGACSLSIGFAQGRTQGNTPPTGVASLRTIEHNAFKAGEKLEYVLHYGLMNAGVATLELKEGGLDILGRKTLHARGEGHKVTTQEKKTFDVPAHAQDMISAFYYARTWDLSALTPGQEFTMDLFMDNENWPLKMKYVGKETIKIRNGKYRCLKFQPMVQKGRIFKSNDDLNVWISDDGNHIPVLVQAKILVGSIKMELSGYEGLANPIERE